MTKKKRKKFEYYYRTCKYCKKGFNSETRYRKVCDICKQQNRKKIWEGYYKKYLERRLKKNGSQRMDTKKN